MKPASYREQQRIMLLADGRSTNYGLGVSVGSFQGHRAITHNGEVSGFSTQNNIYPDDRAAIVVFANLFATDIQGVIANRIADLLFTPADAAMNDKPVAQARAIFIALQKGEVDRLLFTSNANAYFSATAIQDFQASIGSCGTVTDIRQTGTSLRGGMTYRGYRIRCGSKDYGVSTFVMPDGKIEQYIVTPQ
jgi:D-alanyl-D-alanine carboxypeptidase